MVAASLRAKVQPSSVGNASGSPTSSATASVPERFRQWSNHRHVLRGVDNERTAREYHDESDVESDNEDEDIAPEDISGMSTLGVSMSRRQTQLALPGTPVAEREAVLREAPGDDGAAPLSDGLEKTDLPGGEGFGVSLRHNQQGALQFAEPRTLAGTSSSSGAKSSRGTLSRLPKHFDAPSANLFSNIGSLLGLRRAASPEAQTRSGRSENHKGILRTPLRSFSRARSRSVADGRQIGSEGRKTSIFRRASVGSLTSQQPHTEQTQNSTVPGPLMRRTTSESALFRPLSATPSLGDDSRWEHIHEMMNSRSRAIKDSLADANLRFSFSLPGLHAQSPADGIAPPLPNRAPPTASLSPTLQDKETVSRPRAASKVSPTTHPHFAHALEKLTGDVVIMGGYRGSVLRSAKPPYSMCLQDSIPIISSVLKCSAGQQWIPIKVGLNLRRVDLEVGLDPEDEETEHTRIIPSGMLQNIGPIDISRRLLRRLRASNNAQEGRLRVWDFGYDWRLSPHLLSTQLLKFLETLPCNQPDVPKHERGATMISHSLGGLITRHAINTNPLLVKHVIYAGVPQYCVNILGPLRNGDDVLLSSRVLTAQTNFTIRTTYALLPLDGKCFFDGTTKERYDIDFFDPAMYEEYKLSPVIARPHPPLVPPPQSNGNGGIISNIVGSVTGILRNTSGTSTPTNPSIRQTGNKHERGLSGGRSGNDADSSTQPEQHSTGLPHLNDTTSSSHNAMKPQMNDHAGDHDPTSDNPATHVTIPHHLAYAYLNRTLASVKKFKQELAFKPELAHLYPSTAVIFGKSYPTVSGCRVAGREGIKRADAYDDLVFGSGDGVVLARAAMLPDGYEIVKGGVVSSGRGHIGLLGDLEGIGRCLDAVIQDRERMGRRRGRE